MTNHEDMNASPAHFFEDRLLTMKEAASYLKVKRSKIYELIHEPNFPLIILGARGYRVFLSDLDAWILSRKTGL